MSIALFSRTVIVMAYLIALLVNGGVGALTALVAAAIITVWAVALLRDGWARRTSSAIPIQAAGVLADGATHDEQRGAAPYPPALDPPSGSRHTPRVAAPWVPRRRAAG